MELYRWVKASAQRKPPLRNRDLEYKVDDKKVQYGYFNVGESGEIYFQWGLFNAHTQITENLSRVEWLEPIPESEQDELWKGAVEIMADDILDRRQKNIPASVPELIKKLSSTYHLIKK